MQVITLIHYLVISGIELYYSNYFHSLRLIISLYYTIVGSSYEYTCALYARCLSRGFL